MKKEDNPDRAIETSTIRLTADETRAIMKAASANGKPVSDYRMCGLVDLGIMKLVEVAPKDLTQESKDLWSSILKAARDQDQQSIEKSCRQLNEIDRIKRTKEKGHVLTDLGKQIARGVTVKLNGQYKTVAC